MSFKKYEAFLVVFLVTFVLFQILFRFAYYPSVEPSGHALTIMFTVVLLLYMFYYFALSAFLLHASKRGIKNCHEKVAPKKVLLGVTLSIILVSVAYPITTAVVYKVMKTSEPTFENTLTRLKKSATDSSKPVNARLKAAEYYYRYSGAKIDYLDENNERKPYSPSEAVNVNRQKYVETLSAIQDLYKFMRTTAVLSLLSGALVAAIYLGIRKKVNSNFCM